MSYISRAYRKLVFQPLSFLAAWNADVVHNFGRADYLLTLLHLNYPLIMTFENPILEKEISWLKTQRSSKILFTSVSNHQRNNIPDFGDWRTVYNSINLKALPFVERPNGEPYLAFLGRLTSNKGVHIAIKVALATGMKLKIAGNISDEPGGREYFDNQVRPHLNDQVEWIGEVNEEQKAEFLGHAAALLFPIQWDEPYGLVMAEALACGTPVIAIKRASTPEVVNDGVTGFLCNNDSEMIQAVKKISHISRNDCRNECEKRFSSAVMVDNYLKIYQELC